MLNYQIKKITNKISKNSEYKTLNTVLLHKDNLLFNVKFFSKYSNKKIMPVLKANAYGHGLTEVAQMLNEADCEFLCVDGYFEATKIRPITKHNILVLGYIDPSNVNLLDNKKCSYVLQDIASIRAFGATKNKFNIHIELNTGMNRLGLSPGELPEFLAELKKHPNLVLEGVMTHLSDADNPKTDDFTSKQIGVFEKLLDDIKSSGFNPRIIHTSQTAGITKSKSPLTNAMRLGIGLYGINPLDPSDHAYRDLQATKPVMELKSTVIKINLLRAGDRVSYNGIFKAPKGMDVAVLPLGYYEGVPRELSDRGMVVDSHVVPRKILGRVCMNHTMIEGHGLKVGDTITVIGINPKLPNSIHSIASDNGLFKYTLLTNISSSIRRQII